MSHTLDDIGHYWAGDTLVLHFTVDEDGSRKDLTGASIDWWLTRPWESTRTLSLSDTGVSLVMTDAENGEFEIRMASATDTLGGESYHERLQITDADDDQATFGADFSIAEP